MKNLLAMPLVALFAAGCAHSSLEPHSVIRIDRSATLPAVAHQAPNTPDDDPADLGVAPYITQPAPGSAAAAANSVVNVNAPSVAPSPGRLGTTGAGGTTTIAPAAGATSAGTVTGTISSTPTTSNPSGTTATSSIGNTPGTPGAIGTANSSVVNTGTSLGTTRVGTPSPTSGLNNPVGSSLGSGLGGTGTGSATGLSTIPTNNLFNPTNLFGPK